MTDARQLLAKIRLRADRLDDMITRDLCDELRDALAEASSALPATPRVRQKRAPRCTCDVSEDPMCPVCGVVKPRAEAHPLPVRPEPPLPNQDVLPWLEEAVIDWGAGDYRPTAHYLLLFRGAVAEIKRLRAAPLRPVPAADRKEPVMEKILVPDIDGPVEQLCWKQSRTMTRCDRRKGHAGLHTWEHPEPTAPPVPAAKVPVSIDAAEVATIIYAEMEHAAEMDGITFDGEQAGFIRQALEDAVLEAKRQRALANIETDHQAAHWRKDHRDVTALLESRGIVGSESLSEGVVKLIDRLDELTTAAPPVPAEPPSLKTKP